MHPSSISCRLIARLTVFIIYEYEIFLFWLLKVKKNSYQFTLVKQNSFKTFKNSFSKLER